HENCYGENRAICQTSIRRCFRNARRNATAKHGFNREVAVQPTSNISTIYARTPFVIYARGTARGGRQLKTTQNYGLRKPEPTDLYNVDDFNFNADVIDTELFAVKQKADQTESDLASHLNETIQQSVHGLKTTGNVTIYVDAVNGNDDNPGTSSQPLK